MSEKISAAAILENAGDWKAPELSGQIPHGDMPGDKVEIGEIHINKANTIFPELCKLLREKFQNNKKVVITVCGGSGVGKSEIASLLSFYLNQLGVGAYTLSGDNYPHRIPMYNDAERLHVFRESALRGMVDDGVYTKEYFEIIHQLQKEDQDANTEYISEYPWFESYIRNGKAGLAGYLGTEKEIEFDFLTQIIKEFKTGADKIWLKRMGRTAADLWFEEVDFSNVDVLVIEWTHGNSDYYQGVDIPILLNSTPQETLEHRRSRNRDGASDSPFTTMVLELEQAMLSSQAHKAKIILSKNGELLTFEQYKKLMEESHE